jgi:hypothetical protein
MYALNGEPPCDRFLDRVQGVQVPDDDPAILPLQKTSKIINPEEQPMQD